LPVHDRLETTKKFIKCLRKQNYARYHLILVNDDKRDDTAEYVKETVPNVTILKGNGNLWWAGSLTKAYRYLSEISASDEDIVLIINDDSIFRADYFESIIRDEDLNAETLVISPGKDISSDFIERGFSFDWASFIVRKLKAGEEPDAVTTRGLYMKYSTYKTLGPLHPWLLPQYLSDLEYTMRARRKGFKLKISNKSKIFVDRSTTGSHIDESKSLKELFYNHFISKKTAYSTFYWGNFVLLTAPLKYKMKLFAEIYARFYRKAMALKR